MDSNGGAVTPTKDPQSNRLKENSNPNLTSPALKLSKSPVIKSATKSVTKNPNSKNPSPKIASPPHRNKIRERKFVVAKKKKERSNPSTVACKCKVKVGGNSQKCLCVAYESLRVSQEDFFKNRVGANDGFESEQLENSERAETLEAEKPMIQNPKIGSGCEGKGEEIDCLAMNGVDNCDPDEIEQSGELGNLTIKDKPMIQNPKSGNGSEGKGDEIDIFATNGLDNCDPNEIEQSGKLGCLIMKRRRDKLLEEARENVPEPGSGRVRHLVKAFEKLLTIPNPKDSDQKDEQQSEAQRKVLEWALPGLQPPETQVSSSSFCPSDFCLTSESLGLSCSLDSSQASFGITSRTSGGGRRSRRNSSESSGTFGGRHWKRRQLKATCQQPFKLRTEQRGRYKEEEFIKKIEQMLMEEDKQRIPIAQGLPWTTDEPECLVKPPIKEHTKPIDLKLHSDLRAVERAEFDHQVAEKMSLIEQYRMERERQQKLAEEEEIRRLRKELIPRAQPMPYFDRPFIPRRSEKHPTMPREPKFHVPQHKKIKCCMSWNDMYAHYQ